jgi:hypothetical protein
MRYMMLIYSQEVEAPKPEELREVWVKHQALMAETNRVGILRAADPLESSAAATTVRVENGRALITDGPFVETKEQLAGYYILDCNNLDEALAWAAKIPTSCRGSAGCVEVRPIREIAKPALANG